MARVTGIQRLLELLLGNTLMLLKTVLGTSPVVLWIRIVWPTQHSRIRPLAQDDPAYRRAQRQCTTATEQVLQSQPGATTEPTPPRVSTRQEKPLQREAHVPQLESGPRGNTSREICGQ